MSLNPPPNTVDPNIVGNAEGNRRQADTERAHDLSHVPPKGAADA